MIYIVQEKFEDTTGARLIRSRKSKERKYNGWNKEDYLKTQTTIYKIPHRKL